MADGQSDEIRLPSSWLVGTDSTFGFPEPAGQTDGQRPQEGDALAKHVS